MEPVNGTALPPVLGVEREIRAAFSAAASVEPVNGTALSAALGVEREIRAAFSAIRAAPSAAASGARRGAGVPPTP